MDDEAQTPKTATGEHGASERPARTPVRAASRLGRRVKPRQLSDFEPRIGRIPIVEVRPVIDGGEWPSRAFVSDVVPFSATAFREGHDLIGVDLVLIDPRGAETRIRMHAGETGTDRWHTEAQLNLEGLWRFRVEAWGDDFATWLHNAEVKIAADVDAETMIESGALVLERALASGRRSDFERGLLDTAVKRLRSREGTAAERLESAIDDRVRRALRLRPVRSHTTRSREHEIRVERRRVGVGSWYEFFPRSEGAEVQADGTMRSGTFRTAAKRLPAIAAMGFDVVYIPPIHPIGQTNRKGRNNALTAEPGDPGSPYGIGSHDGGHDAVNPDLGTEADLEWFVGEVKRNGLELALDLALQASPDHPWVEAHPEWFTQLPDGSIAYAENPPKKYQDIYPLSFDRDFEGLTREIIETVRHWISFGIRIFRVDNPHTKPLSFWERLIHEINAEHPDVIFLSEAFTRPAMMRTLAKIGFQQSYTYFTWRNTKEELEEYLTELSKETSDYLHPNLFVNTHDILTPYLQFGGRPAYEIRAIVAAMASPTWGVYSGYEHIENVARPGSEENIDNEKYELKPRDWGGIEERGGSIAPLITRLNEIRAEHPALQQLRNFEAHWSSDDSLLVFSKHLDGVYTESGEGDTIIVVVNLDPHGAHEGQAYLDPQLFGLPENSEFDVRDLLTGDEYRWGPQNYVRLDPFTRPAHIMTVLHGERRSS